MFIVLVVFGWISQLGPPYWVGMVMIGACLIWEHWMSSTRDLKFINRAFFFANAVISFVFLAAVAGEVIGNR
jgi:4-hydroxybenzoate polyprenyltransferase